MLDPCCSTLNLQRSKAQSHLLSLPTQQTSTMILSPGIIMLSPRDNHACLCPQVLHVMVLALRDLAFSPSSSGSFMLIGSSGGLIGILHTPMGNKVAVVGTSSALTDRARLPAQILCQTTTRSYSRIDARCVANQFDCPVATHV